MKDQSQKVGILFNNIWAFIDSLWKANNNLTVQMIAVELVILRSLFDTNIS